MPLEESSGDVADMMELNGALWVLLGDATGHGLLAHAVIDGVRHLWKVLLAQSHEGIDPLELFQKVDQRLQDCLPVGMFVEAILIRFSSDPYFTAAVAGYARLVLRRAGSSSVEICRLGSSYLGPVGEAPEEQMNFDFQPGDEVALATDGLFDHPYPDGTLIDGLQETLSGAISHVSLYQALVNSLEEAGRLCKQEDDVTLITIRKMSTTGGTYD
jgi:serine phosphatase RsbU (regulator of sigma subunit)